MIEDVINDDVVVNDITEDGSIWVEQRRDGAYLYTEEVEINLNNPYSIKCLSITQNEQSLEIPTTIEMEYLLQILEELNGS
jgi:hypothetical protein